MIMEHGLHPGHAWCVILEMCAYFYPAINDVTLLGLNVLRRVRRACAKVLTL